MLYTRTMEGAAVVVSMAKGDGVVVEGQGVDIIKTKIVFFSFDPKVPYRSVRRSLMPRSRRFPSAACSDMNNSYVYTEVHTFNDGVSWSDWWLF